jgi:small redox-active disulfide protein 2
MVIKILGSGCPCSQRLEKLVKEAVVEMKSDASIEKIQDIQKIMDYGIMSTPALVIDEKVKVSGRVPDKDTIKKLIKSEQ